MAVKYRFDNLALKRLRLSSGKKPELLALILGLTKEAYIAYETGRSTPPTNRVFQLCDELGCRPEDLLRPVAEPMAEVVKAAVKKSTRKQRLPEKVTDPAALDEAAELLRRRA